jgi:hypothetical protein
MVDIRKIITMREMMLSEIGGPHHDRLCVPSAWP